MMTLPIGNKRSADPAAQRAFTLIELILVMAMLITVIAVAAPSLSNFFRGRTLDGEARRFLSLTRYAQSRAASEGVPMIVWIDAKEGTYGLEEEAGYSTEDVKAVRLELDPDLSIEVEQSRVPVVETITLDQTRQFSRDTTRLRFLPDGTISEISPEGVAIRETRRDQETKAAPAKETDPNVVWIRRGINRRHYEIQTNVWPTAHR
ncbi:MAG: GspH/FimT family pseudopilin [Verrucomicrobiota bacterium]